MNKKIGLFFGSFNPIHIGHLIIAEYIVEHSDLKELWFVVSPCNPLKKKQSLLNDLQRLYMVNIAIEDDPRFHYFSSTDFDQDQKIQAIKEIYESLKVKEKTEQAINLYAAKALSSLQAVSVSEDRKNKLYELANTLVSRDK